MLVYCIKPITTTVGCRWECNKDCDSKRSPANLFSQKSEIFDSFPSGEAYALPKGEGGPLAVGEVTFSTLLLPSSEGACAYYRHSRRVMIVGKDSPHIMGANTAEILATVPEEYRVQNFEEIAPGVIAIATWGGVKLYKIADN